MNCRYFGCGRCKTYTDAGYRWAYWQLEDAGVVSLGKPVSADAVLAATPYWNPPAEERSAWLCEEILPRVRRYLASHREHDLLYFEEDDPGGLFADWVETVESKPA